MTAVAERPAQELTELSEEQLEELYGRRALLDPVTHQPHLILEVDLPAVCDDDERQTYHHFWYYRRDPELGGGVWPTDPWTAKFEQLAGLFVRMSTGEDLKRSTHAEGHSKRRFPRGPILPVTLEDKFKAGVGGLVGVVPEQVIDLTQPVGEELVTVDAETFADTAGSHRVGLEHFLKADVSQEAKHIIGTFLLRYALTQDMDKIDQSLINRFKTYKRPRLRMDMAREILANCLDLAVEPFRDELEAFRQAGLVQPDRQDAMTELHAIIPDSAYGPVVRRVDSEINQMLARTRIEREIRNKQRREENLRVEAAREAAAAARRQVVA